eukprot:6203894-Pleurochrysis_carterae.AAC.1
MIALKCRLEEMSDESRGGHHVALTNPAVLDTMDTGKPVPCNYLRFLPARREVRMAHRRRARSFVSV